MKKLIILIGIAICCSLSTCAVHKAEVMDVVIISKQDTELQCMFKCTNILNENKDVVDATIYAPCEFFDVGDTLRLKIKKNKIWLK